MAEGVLASEATFLKLRGLLDDLNRFTQHKRDIPTGCHLGAVSLVTDFKSKRTVLRKLRAAFEKEFVSREEKAGGLLG
jgi:hypothetical protein